MSRIVDAKSTLLVVLLAAWSRVEAADRMAPGQWEFTMTTKGVAHVSKYCVDADLAAVVGVMKTKAGSVETTTDVKARRLGACPK